MNDTGATSGQPAVYLFSGPCGCGKSTLADAFAKHLVNRCGQQQVYVIHGDDFHHGFVERDDKGPCFVDGQPTNALDWPGILAFNWECILMVAGKALGKGLDVVIDYVVEEELPLVRELARTYDARLYYVVLTASREEIRRRITQRGDVELIERAWFLKDKLESMPENQGHVLDNTALPAEREAEQLDIERYRLNV